MSEIRPAKISLETSTLCQLRCPSCPTASKAIYPNIGLGFLKFNNFKKIVDENPWISEIELANWGEIFLNPDLKEIIKYAHQRKVALTANIGVNLNKVKEDVLEALVKYKFHRITCSIDGASNETYKVYRVRGNLDAVIDNIKRINYFKKKYQSKYPLLVWQFVVFGYNEHEIPLARKMASDLDMGFRPKLSWDSEFSPIKNQEFVKKEIGLDAVSREEFKKAFGYDHMESICHQLWDQPQINWDGRILGCCRNFWSEFGGNAFKDNLSNCINSEKIDYARDMILGEKPARADIPCATCNIYSGMKTDGRWLNRRVRSFPYSILKFVYRFFGLHHLRKFF